MSKFAIVSFAVVLLGSSAALAQPYGYGRGYGPPNNGRGYGPPPGNINGPTPGYCGPMTSNITNWILDPATGQPITESQYLSRYPSNPATWSYSCNTGLWTDPNAQSYAAGEQFSERDRGRGEDRARDRERERERDQDRERERERDRGDQDYER